MIPAAPLFTVTNQITECRIITTSVNQKRTKPIRKYIQPQKEKQGKADITAYLSQQF